VSLERLLRPKTVAVIGGGAWCAAVIDQCRRSGWDGELIPVHPSRDSVQGVAAVATVDDLPWAPDASFIGVNRAATIEVLRSLSNRGSGGAVCFASGFRESDDADGARLQAALFDAAGQMTVLGPNCYGFINNLDGAALWPDQHGLKRQDAGVAILTQSSNIAINLTMQKRGLPIAYVITTGNQAQQDLATVAMSLLDDDRVTAIGLHIEGFNDVPGFEAFMQAAFKKSIPVVALKVGASDEAQRATQSHTASLAGSQAGAEALLNRLGAISVNSLPVFLESLKLLHVYGGLPGGRIASLSCSGGEASLMADAVHRTPGLSLPEISEESLSVLRDNLGPHVSKVNPLDYHTDIWRNRSAMSTVFSAMTGSSFDLTVIVLDFPRSDRCELDDWAIAVDAIIDASKSPGARVAILGSLAENIPEDAAAQCIANGIAPLMELDTALSAVAAVSQAKPPPSRELWSPKTQVSSEEVVVVDEADAKSQLSSCGVITPKRCTVSSPEEARVAATQMTGPLVLKGLGRAHKSDSGWVVLNLSDADDVHHAATGMSPQPETWLLESMVTDVVAELLVGVVHDPAHGFVLTLASGGVLTEILRDSVTLLLPVTEMDVDIALQSLSVAPMISGYRGQTAANKDAIVEQVMAVQSFVEQHRSQLIEVEINPLLCTQSGAVAADALLVLEQDT